MEEEEEDDGQDGRSQRDCDGGQYLMRSQTKEVVQFKCGGCLFNYEDNAGRFLDKVYL